MFRRWERSIRWRNKWNCPRFDSKKEKLVETMRKIVHRLYDSHTHKIRTFCCVCWRNCIVEIWVGWNIAAPLLLHAISIYFWNINSFSFSIAFLPILFLPRSHSLLSLPLLILIYASEVVYLCDVLVGAVAIVKFACCTCWFSI